MLLQIEREICEREGEKREGGEKYVVLLGVDKSTLAVDVAVAAVAAVAATQKAASRRE